MRRRHAVVNVKIIPKPPSLSCHPGPIMPDPPPAIIQALTDRPPSPGHEL